MSRIPFRDNPRGVLDNLVPTTRTALARAGAPDMVVCSRFPRDRHDWKTAIRGAFDFFRLIPIRDMVHYVRRLLVWLTSCDERRLHEYEHVAWWDFTQASQRSPGYQQFLGQGFTRLMVAIRAEEGSTRTVGAIGLQLGLGLLTHGVDVDSVLSGPTNEMWIDRGSRTSRSSGWYFSTMRPSGGFTSTASASATSPSSRKDSWSTSPPTTTSRLSRSKS